MLTLTCRCGLREESIPARSTAETLAAIHLDTQARRAYRHETSIAIERAQRVRCAPRKGVNRLLGRFA